MTKLELAIAKATEWHADREDKAGEPYILHPLSVMFRVRRNGYNEDTQIAAVLHDVVEDCGDVDLNDIDHYFGAAVVDAVDALTRRPGERYGAYIDRVTQNQMACAVKAADIDDNLDPNRRRGRWAIPERLRKRYEDARTRLSESRPGFPAPEGLNAEGLTK